MASINEVVLIGRIVRDVEPRKTESGKDVCSFTIAVDGFKENDTNFINCVAWGKTVEILDKFTSKGKQVAITGRLQTRNYETKDGEKRTTTEVVVNQVQLLGNKSTDSEGTTNTKNSDIAPENIDDKPIDLSKIPF